MARRTAPFPPQIRVSKNYAIFQHNVSFCCFNPSERKNGQIGSTQSNVAVRFPGDKSLKSLKPIVYSPGGQKTKSFKTYSDPSTL